LQIIIGDLQSEEKVSCARTPQRITYLIDPPSTPRRRKRKQSSPQ